MSIRTMLWGASAARALRPRCRKTLTTAARTAALAPLALAGCGTPLRAQPVEPKSRAEMMMSVHDDEFVNAERVGPNWAEGTQPQTTLAESMRVVVTPRAREGKVQLVPSAAGAQVGSRVACSVPPNTTAEQVVYAWLCRPEATPSYD